MAKKKVTKKTAPKRTKTVSRPRVSSSMGPSYDTKMIVTILLLLLAYPLGIIFMWGWMRTWPTWLKVVISLPLIISLLFIFLIFYAVGNAIRHRVGLSTYEMRIQEGPLPTNTFEVSPTVSPYKSY